MFRRLRNLHRRREEIVDKTGASKPSPRWRSRFRGWPHSQEAGYPPEAEAFLFGWLPVHGKGLIVW